MYEPLTHLPESVDFGLVEEGMARDIVASLKTAIAAGAHFEIAPEPLAIFRNALRASIRKLERNKKQFALFIRFLRDGPYEASGPIPKDVAPTRLSDDETRKAISYIVKGVVNAFKGALAELLAAGPSISLMERLRDEGVIAGGLKVYVGDASMMKAGKAGRRAKAADILFLSPNGEEGAKPRLVGIAEVKANADQLPKINRQIDHQLGRAHRGILLRGPTGSFEEIAVATFALDEPVRIKIIATEWPLSRAFRIETQDGETGLFVDRPEPPNAADSVAQIGPSTWRIQLRWSNEALTSAAFDMTFWLMGEIGAVLYRDKRPKEWDTMSPEEAGANAAKMMLYYATLRARNPAEWESAVALYNTYGFGYALGANFRDEQGRIDMLFPKDLTEIAERGFARTNHRIRQKP